MLWVGPEAALVVRAVARAERDPLDGWRRRRAGDDERAGNNRGVVMTTFIAFLSTPPTSR